MSYQTKKLEIESAALHRSIGAMDFRMAISKRLLATSDLDETVRLIEIMNQAGLEAAEYVTKWADQQIDKLKKESE